MTDIKGVTADTPREPTDSTYAVFGRYVAALLGSNEAFFFEMLDKIEVYAAGLTEFPMLGDVTDEELAMWRTVADQLGIAHDGPRLLAVGHDPRPSEPVKNEGHAVRLRIILDNQDAAESPTEPYTLNVYRDDAGGTQSDDSVELADGNECLLGADIPTMLRALADSWPTDVILPACAECGESISADDVHAHDGICGSCDHNARRAG